MVTLGKVMQASLIGWYFDSEHLRGLLRQYDYCKTHNGHEIKTNQVFRSNISNTSIVEPFVFMTLYTAEPSQQKFTSSPAMC